MPSLKSIHVSKRGPWCNFCLGAETFLIENSTLRSSCVAGNPGIRQCLTRTPLWRPYDVIQRHALLRAHRRHVGRGRHARWRCCGQAYRQHGTVWRKQSHDIEGQTQWPISRRRHFKCIFLDENLLTKIWLNFIPNGPIDKSSLL